MIKISPAPRELRRQTPLGDGQGRGCGVTRRIPGDEVPSAPAAERAALPGPAAARVSGASAEPSAVVWGKSR